MDYWNLVDPIWESISIYDGPDVFLQQFGAVAEKPRTLFAAHWCQSEVCNGGFHQFFSNSTGVLAPEASQAFRSLGMPQVGALVEGAMSLLGPTFPRDRAVRQRALSGLRKSASDSLHAPFQALDEAFFQLIGVEAGGFETASNSFAEERG